MATNQLREIIGHLRKSLLPRAEVDSVDAQLLESFLNQRDEAAFATIVRRHGRMVMNTCFRVLRDARDAQPILDQELSRLPEKYRVPIVLCDLEQKSHKEAARQLGWPQVTLSGRLSRGRDLLATRLSRRGVPLVGGTLAVLLLHNNAS